MEAIPTSVIEDLGDRLSDLESRVSDLSLILVEKDSPAQSLPEIGIQNQLDSLFEKTDEIHELLASRHHPDKLLNAVEACQYLRLRYGDLKRYRQEGTGPKFYNQNRRVFYRIADLDAFMSSNTKELP